MFSNEEDEPASVVVSTSIGNKYDINNISGIKRKQLIMEGEVREEAFATPANLPGKKLKEYREKHSKNFLGIENKHDDTPNVFKVGDLIKYKGVASEVLKVHSQKGLLVHKREGGKTWVHHSKVEVIEPKDD